MIILETRESNLYHSNRTGSPTMIKRKLRNFDYELMLYIISYLLEGGSREGSCQGYSLTIHACRMYDTLFDELLS